MIEILEDPTFLGKVDDFGKCRILKNSDQSFFNLYLRKCKIIVATNQDVLLFKL